MSEPNFKLLDHFHNPRNVGIINNADGFGRGENPINGYLTDIYIKIENGRITDIKFKTFGCVVSVTSASALTEAVKGKTLEEIVNGSNPAKVLIDVIKEKLGEIPEKNWHCAPTAVLTLLNAICDYFRKNQEKKRILEVEKLIADVNDYFEEYKSIIGKL
jgi:nitrogen fixation NifU-like protein